MTVNPILLVLITITGLFPFTGSAKKIVEKDSMESLSSTVTVTGSVQQMSDKNPNFIATSADLKARIPEQLRATKPDYVVFVPEVTDEGVTDTGNEHLLVFDGPDGSLMAVWTQSSAESQPDQHLAFARSDDEGVTWTRPSIIAGPKKPGDGHMASWGYPLVSKSGRIYIHYSQHIGRVDNQPHHTGWLHGIYSDDNGITWSKAQNIPIPRSIYDNPDPTMPPNVLCWQKPQRLGKDGKYLAGITRWTSFAVTPNPTKSFMSAEAHVEFMRFENIDDNPEVQDIHISWFATNKEALSVPFPSIPSVCVCQEPSIMKLPDGRLFCVMRTSAGSPYWSVSADAGETWTQPRRLLRKDGGTPLLHPLSPCPMYDVGGSTAASGHYVLFIHNHDGHYKNFGPTDLTSNRRPICIVRGTFKAGADQPVWFDEPVLFMDHDGVSLGKPGTKGRQDMALYSSFTVRKGVPVLWYPDRKFFLLGKKIPAIP
ncbi:MAG: sialidase family protein [Kiritimatiellales bacterium]